MRVFCPEHKRGFFAPRQSPIKCENRGHLLGEIDFEGQALTPVEIHWQYCCNCEHFCPLGFDQFGLQRCAVCTRKSSLLYLCDRCHVISFESNTPLQTKNFTLTPEGAPQPSCPGCLRPASADLHEHVCEDLNATFITGLSSCPVCMERLDVAPSFPSLVAQYLKRTRSANKMNATFDYETGSFVPVEDGEFVVVTNLDQPIVLPRATRFSTKRDFYEFYQDYYHCPNPDAGDLQIVKPASVARAANGWTLEATGVLEVIPEQPKRKIVTPAIQPPVAKREEPPKVAAKPAPQPAPQKEAAVPVKEQLHPQPGVRACPDCGSQIEAKYAFCWKCGNAMNDQHQPPGVSGRKPTTTVSSLPLDLDDDELTVQHETRPLSSTMFSWTSPRKPEHPPTTTRGSVLKLIAIATISLLLVSLGLFSLFRSDAPSAAATAAPPETQTQTGQPQPAVAVTTEVSRNAPAETTTQQLPVNPEDELKKLRERGMAAKESDRTRIFQAFVKIEKQYPRDYRFPYERAKLAVRGSKATSRSEAFKALNTAAEKAITTGKATEMLNGLETDKAGDFSKLSQRRFEWSLLVAALKRKDTSLLTE